MLAYQKLARQRAAVPPAPIGFLEWIQGGGKPAGYQVYLGQHQRETVGELPDLQVRGEFELWYVYPDGAERRVAFYGAELLLLLLVEREVMAAKLAFTGMGTGSWPGNVPYDQQPWWRWGLWAEFASGRAEGERCKHARSGP